MYREDGKLAAKGRHVKYLPMGRMWDLSMQPFLFPLVRKLSHLQHDHMLKDLERTKVSGRGSMDTFERPQVTCGYCSNFSLGHLSVPQI